MRTTFVPVESIEDFSQRLFNRQRLLPVMAFLGREHLTNGASSFCVAEIAERSGIKEGELHKEVAVLRSIGIIKPLPKEPGQRRLFFGFNKTTLWHAAIQLEEEWR